MPSSPPLSLDAIQSSLATASLVSYAIRSARRTAKRSRWLKPVSNMAPLCLPIHSRKDEADFRVCGFLLRASIYIVQSLLGK